MQLNNWEKHLKFIERMYTFTLEVAPYRIASPLYRYSRPAFWTRKWLLFNLRKNTITDRDKRDDGDGYENVT